MTKLNQSIRIIKEVQKGIFKFINNYNEDTLYVFDLEDVKEQYLKIKNMYASYPDHFNIWDFAQNYSFSYYQKNNLLDQQEDANVMTTQIVNFIEDIKI